jgi:hypothetical protein
VSISSGFTSPYLGEARLKKWFEKRSHSGKRNSQRANQFLIVNELDERPHRVNFSLASNAKRRRKPMQLHQKTPGFL